MASQKVLLVVVCLLALSMLRLLWWSLERAGGFATGSASLAANGVSAPKLELQINSRFWQLLSQSEMLSLTELQNQGNGLRRIIPLQSIFPIFQSIENIDSRNRQGELLRVGEDSLEDSYLQVEDTGELRLVLGGEFQQAPQQLNVEGNVWPEATLSIWMEDDLKAEFLLDELETYQRFHNIQVEVFVHKNLELLAGQALQQAEDVAAGAMPDMILADSETTMQLRSLLEPLSARKKKEQESIAYLEQFVSDGQVYASPLFLEPYSLLYNANLIDFATSEKKNNLLNLTDIFAQLEEASAMRGTEKSDPYFLGIEQDGLPFALLLSSFLKDTDVSEVGPRSPEVSAGLQYLREQGQKSLLRQLDFVGERFANGNIAVVIVRSGNLQQIRTLMSSPSGNRNQLDMRVRELPYNDLYGKQVPSYTELWSMSIWRGSTEKRQAEGLRSYLLRGAVQGQFDLASGFLPSNTLYYPFYQHSRYYPLLPKGELRYAMNSEQLWEYGIAQRLQSRRIKELKQLFEHRIEVLLDSNTGLSLVLADMQKQWDQEVVPMRRLLFLR